MMLPERILIIVPHSDDEALLSAGLIHHAITQGKTIFVAVVTNGDYLCPDQSKGIKRLQESQAAMLKLGVLQKNLYFFGYPDTGMEQEVSFLTNLKNAPQEEKIFPSSCGQETYGISKEFPEYCFLRTGKHALYNRVAFKTDLHELLCDTKPHLVITTSYYDLHGDHSALSWFVRRELKERKDYPTPILWEGMVHSPAGDDVWPNLGKEERPFSRIPELETNTDLIWDKRISIPTPEEFKNQKQQNIVKKELILSYKTAFCENDEEVSNYLISFSKADEIFWEINYS